MPVDGLARDGEKGRERETEAKEQSPRSAKEGIVYACCQLTCLVQNDLRFRRKDGQQYSEKFNGGLGRLGLAPADPRANEPSEAQHV